MEKIIGPMLPRIEPLSPFVPFDPADRESIPEELIAGAEQQSLVLDLLQSPESVLERVLDPARVRGTILTALMVTGGGYGLFGAATRAHTGTLEALRAGALTGAGVAIAVAAVLAPIYGTSLLLAARLPVSRLISLLLAAVATGALVLAPLAPVVALAIGFDALWMGPIALCTAFAIAALAAAARLKTLLEGLAEEIARASGTSLRPSDRERAGMLARIGMMLLGVCGALALWAFDALG